MSKRKGSSGTAVAVICAGLMIAGVGKHHGHGGLDVLTTFASQIPSGSAYTPRSWARALLRAEGLPRTRCNVRAITAWEAAEGGHWANSARFNPLDTTQREPGSYAMNSVGVQAYTSWRSGFRATTATLNNGRYGAILGALHAGDDAQAVANAVGSSPWGTGAFTATC